MNNNNKRVTLAMYSDARIALIQEVRNHSRLMDVLYELGPNVEWSEHLAHIAAYCSVVLDGLYTPEDLDVLCNILYWKLKKKNTIILH